MSDTPTSSLPTLADRKKVLEGRLAVTKAQLFDVRTTEDNLTAAQNQYEGALAMLNELIAIEPLVPTPAPNLHRLKSV